MGNSMTPGNEYRYDLEPPPVPEGFKAPNGSRGLSDLLSLGNRELLALERSFVIETTGPRESRKTDQIIELFHVDLKDATPVQQVPSLASAADIRPARKTKLLDARKLIPQLHPDYQSLDNFEGICFGPTLDDGTQTILLISDDNFNPYGQRTALFVFRWAPSR